jgi:selenocysteine lyase/cysteine desulfurase
VHSGTGVKLPVARLAAAVKARAPDALVVLDAVHGFGAEAAGPGALGCDVFVSGCHKWLMGPRGTGLVWATPAAWQRVTPVIPTFSAGTLPGPFHTPGGFHAFEHRWALAQAFGFQRALGPARIQARVRALAARLRRALAGIGGVRVITPPGALMAGLVMIDLANAPAERAVAELRSAGIETSVPPYAQRYVRFGTQVTLSPADVDAAVRAVRRLA